MTTGGQLGKRASGDFDLNLAPIIDCFTVLITYLLVSASFISLAVLDAGIAATEPPNMPQPAGSAQPSVEIALGAAGDVTIHVTGAPAQDGAGTSAPVPRGPIPPRNGGMDMVRVVRELDRLRRSFPGLGEITVSAGATVPYKEVVRAIEVIRKIIPKVYLAG